MIVITKSGAQVEVTSICRDFSGHWIAEKVTKDGVSHFPVNLSAVVKIVDSA